MKDIQTFLTIVNRCNGSFSKAESLLHVTQPAISKRMASLGKRLNVRLFEKVGHKMQLTESGRVFYDYAMSINLEWENACSKLGQLNNQQGATLKLAASHYIADHYLFEVLQPFREQHPQVEYDVQFLNSSDEVKQALLKFESDIGLMIEPKTTPTLLRTIHFSQDCVYVTTGKNSHMNTTRQHITLEDLRGYAYIAAKTDTLLGTLSDAFLQEHGIIPPQTTYHPSCDTIKKMVSLGAGWAILPDKCIDPDHMIKLPFLKGKKINIVLAYHGKRLLPAVARQLVNVIQEGSY